MNWDFREARRATVHKGGKESDTTEQLILQAVGQAPGSRLGAASTMWGGGWTPSRPPSQVWLQGPASPRSAAPGKVECGRCEGVTPDGKRHPKITVPPHTPNRRLPPPPLGLPVPRLPSLPLAACSCVCSTSGLLAKTQVGCSTTPCLVWVWKIWRSGRRMPGDRGSDLLFPLPSSLLLISTQNSLLQEALPDSLPC